MHNPYEGILYECRHNKDDVRREVDAILQAHEVCDMEHRHGLANHLVWVALPMLMMGTPSEVVKMRVEKYVKKLEPRKGPAGVNVAVAGGWAKVVTRDDLRGICGATLHPFLHLAAGVYLDSALLVSQAVTWMRRSNVQGDTHKYQGGLLQLVAATSHDDLVGLWPDPPSRGVVERAKAVLQHHPLITSCSVAGYLPGDGLAYITACTGLLLATRNEFVALHGVTSSWGLRVLTSSCEEPLKALLTSAWVRSFFALYAAVGMPQCGTFMSLLGFAAKGNYSSMLRLLGVPVVPSKMHNWAPLHATALANEDEHPLKTVWMLRTVHSSVQDPYLCSLLYTAARCVADPRSPPDFTPSWQTTMRGVPLQSSLQALKKHYARL